MKIPVLILMAILCLMCITGTASAYGLYVDCPDTVQVGMPLKCSVDSNFPAGKTFDLVFYYSKYTATEVARESVTIQDNQVTQYKLFDTQGYPGGSYKVEVQFPGTGESSLSSDSVTLQMVTLQDRSSEITITSPPTQTINDALRIEGSIAKVGNNGIQLEVRGPDGVAFTAQWIGTTTDMRSGAGVFTKKVTVTTSGEYTASFTDSNGYVGKVNFVVEPTETSTPTTIPTTTAIPTTKKVTTIPTTYPTPTQSPISPLTMIGALGITGLLVTLVMRRR
jgi:hypothetical protein